MLLILGSVHWSDAGRKKIMGLFKKERKVLYEQTDKLSEEAVVHLVINTVDVELITNCYFDWYFKSVK